MVSFSGKSLFVENFGNLSFMKFILHISLLLHRSHNVLFTQYLAQAVTILKYIRDDGSSGSWRGSWGLDGVGSG